MNFMNGIFKSYLNLFVIVFIDDSFVYFKTKEEHIGHLHIVLRILKEKQFYAKLFKFEF